MKAEARTLLVPGGYGRAVEVRAGEYLAIEDVEGQQVGDLVAFRAGSHHHWLSTAHTRNALRRLYPRVGDRLVSNWREPMLEVVEDTVGRHDLISPACDPRRYLLQYGVADHRSCLMNLTEALAPYGIEPWRIPQPFNVFMNTVVHPDGSYTIEEPLSQAGDRLVLQALMDLVVALSACPQDLSPVNAGKISDLRIHVLDRWEPQTKAVPVASEASSDARPSGDQPAV